MNEWLLRTITWLFFASGIAGALIPLLPSLPLVLTGIVFYGYFHAWRGLDARFWIITSAIAAAGWLLELAAGTALLGTRSTSPQTKKAALCGVLLGPLILGPIGIVLGPLASASLAELLQGSPPAAALGIGLWALGGVFLAVLVKLGSLWTIIFWFWRNV